MQAVEAVTARIREASKLGLGLMSNVAHTLESNGIKVVAVDVSDHRLDGLCGIAGDEPVIVVASNRPGDLQRFTLARELGHLVLNRRLTPEIDKEAACDRLAGAFLVPERTAKEVLGSRHRSLSYYELYLLKQEYGLSIAAWIHRDFELEVVSGDEYGRLRKWIEDRGWGRTEPGGDLAQECPVLFERTVRKALSEDLIGESKAAELIWIPQSEVAARERMESWTENESH